MKILLSQTYSYFYTRMGAAKITRALVEKLAQRGHDCRVVVPASIQPDVPMTTAQLLPELYARDTEVVSFSPEAVVCRHRGVEIHAVADRSGRSGRPLRVRLIQQIKRFEPDWVITCDDYNLTDTALQVRSGRVLSFLTSTLVVPFGPDAWEQDAEKTKRLQQTAGTLTLSQFMCRYLKHWGGLEAEPLLVSDFGEQPFPRLGCFDRGYVTLINPSAVKGLPIFLALARQLPEVQFAAVPTWGTSSADCEALEQLPNVHVLAPSDNIDDILSQTRILLAPSLYHEVFGLVATEAMLRGIPVIASDAGGLPEAKLGIDYVIPVRPIEKFEPPVNGGRPRPVVPDQTIGPWIEALRRLLTDRSHYEQLANESRSAAIAFVDYLDTKAVDKFEHYLGRLAPAAGKAALAKRLSSDQQTHLALELSKKLSHKRNEAVSQIPRLECRENLPLSFAQQRLWFLAQLVPDNPFYNVPTVWQFNGELNPTALAHSLDEIVRRHEVLRTTFPDDAGQPRQVIAPPAPVPVAVVDLQHLPEAEQDARIQQLIDEDASRPFNLAHGPLLRATRVSLRPATHVLILSFHHIVFDGWSTGVLVRELTAHYQAFAAGQPAPLPPLPVQYADFAAWQRGRLQGERLEQHIRYWKQQLNGAPPSLNLPTDYARPEIQSFRGSFAEITLPGVLSDALRALSDREGTTLFMTMLAAFNALLHRYTHQTDIVVGSGIANRNQRELELLIGFFVNAIPIRTDLSGKPGFQELLERVRAVTLAAYAHQDLPFEKLVEELRPERNLNRAPIFQVSFVYQNFPDLFPAGEAPFLSLYPKPVFSRTSKFDLTLYLLDGPEQKLLMEYNADLFEAGTIGRMLGHFQQLLEGIAADPQQSIASIPIVPAPEQRTILHDWNQTRCDYPADQTLAQGFEAQVRRSPRSAALVYGDTEMTYQALNRRANRLAHYLQKLGVGPETRVGVCLERSVDMVVAILAILKAGGAYLPLDPDYPPERIAFMLDDSQVSILVTWESIAPLLPVETVQVVHLDTDWAEIAREGEDDLASTAGPDHLAYIIYTSGSTGQPKGTLLEHRGVCNLVQAQQKAFAVEPGSQVYQFASLNFDASVSEIFVTLLSGATLVLPPGVSLLGNELIELLQRHAVTILTCTPSVWATLPEKDLPLLKTVVSAGEACPAGVAARWAPGRRFINAYGPTETSVCATLNSDISGQDRPSIGRPIDNVQIYVLDDSLRPVPVGVTGEIYIGGVGLARGYWRRPDLTAERFIPHPFSAEPGARLYRTGDLGRYLADGNLEYLGRLDHQVKRLGIRVELGEIERALEAHPAVREAVVTLYTPEGAPETEAQFVAYAVLDQDELAHLDQIVPELDLPGEQVSQWQFLFDDNYDRNITSRDPTFNIAGWNSSYTGLPIPDEEMREWVDQTVARVLAHAPRRVLEIGCGTGLLLFRVAPQCEMYWGTDFSAMALKSIQQAMADTEMQLPQVELCQRMADDFTGIPPQTFDLVILNSVVQYFPSAAYLVSVLEQALQATRPGGCIFIGDIRSLPLLESFHASVQMHKALASLPVSQLWEHIQRRVNEEDELALDPAFFGALKHLLPRISRVDMQLKRGRACNELTKFRYDVCLYVEADDPRVEADTLDWQTDRLTLTAVRQRLSQVPSRALVVTHVPDARLQADLRALPLMAAAPEKQTVGELREVLLCDCEDGMDPEAFWDLGERLNYAVNIHVSERPLGCYTVAFKPSGSVSGWVAAKTETLVSPRPWYQYTNNSLHGILSLRLAPHLRLFLQDRLPDHMIPSAFYILDRFSLNPSGKIDRRTLPVPGGARRHMLDHSLVVPRDPIELQLTHIWEDVLKVHPIGVTDNFFELGGHSLLAVALVSRIEAAFGEGLPLSALFQQPTIELLAASLRQKVGFVSESALVAIQPRGSKPPFFCVHPAGGNVICYTDLARCLGPDQPFYGLQDPRLAKECDHLTTIEEIAQHYLMALSAVRPQGPYLLGGWSLGAYVALEMAQQLLAAGQEVPFLAVFDTSAPRPWAGDIQETVDDAALMTLILQEVGRTFGISVNLPAEALGDNLSPEQVRNILEQFQEGGMTLSESEVLRLLEYGRRYGRVYRKNMAAAQRYVFRPYPGPIALFKVAQVDSHDLQLNPMYSEPLYGWEQVSPLIDVYSASGTHHTVLYEPHVRAIAEALQTCLGTAVGLEKVFPGAEKIAG